MSKASFPGFSLETLKFLDQLERNNNRDWFHKNKDRYESAVRGPALEFIEAMAEPIKKISPHFRVEAKKVGGSLMRVYRDTRFSHDKTPYKTNVGIHFRHIKGKDVHAPGFYVHIDPDSVFVGAGIWHPDSAALQKIRQVIDKKQADWNKIVKSKAFTGKFERQGESLKRPPRGYKEEHPLIRDLKLKDHFAIANLEHDIITGKSLVTQSAKLFAASSKYMKFLCNALKVKF